MARFRSICGAAFLLLALVVSPGCGDDDNGTPSGPTVVSRFSVSPSVTAEPLVLTPEFMNDEFCSGSGPFTVRLALLIAARTREALALRRIDFRFTDRRGLQTIPTASPIPMPQPGESPAGTIPTSSPVPIPEPGSGESILINPGTVGRFPFMLRFGCGVAPAGSLKVTVGTMSAGRSQTSEVTVRVSN